MAPATTAPRIAYLRFLARVLAVTSPIRAASVMASGSSNTAPKASVNLSRKSMWFSIVIIGFRPGRALPSRDGSAEGGPTKNDEDERHGVLLFVRVQTGRDEAPHLPQDGGRGHEQAGDDAHLHLHPERLGRRGEHELIAELGDPPGQTDAT